MAPEKKPLKELAAGNPKVDLDLLGEFQRLTDGLPATGQGAAYSLGERLSERQSDRPDQIFNRSLGRFWSHGNR